MNNAIMIATAAGVAYKMTGIAGLAAGKLFEVAVKEGVGYMFGRNEIIEKPEEDVAEFGELSQYERMTEPDFMKAMKQVSLQHIIMEMDIESRVKSARSVVSSVDKLPLSDLELHRTLLEDTTEICDRITSTLVNGIYSKIDRYNSSWLRSIVSLNLTEEMKELRLQSILLFRRKKRLMDSLAFETTERQLCETASDTM